MPTCVGATTPAAISIIALLAARARRALPGHRVVWGWPAWVGVLLASLLIGTEDGRDDYFRADRAWFFYIALLTIGYMVARGLAKSGSRDFYDAR